VPFMLQALDFSLEEPRRAVVVGRAGAPTTTKLLHAIHSVYQPNKVVLGSEGPVEPFAKSLPQKENPLVYICTGTACQAPTDAPEKVRKLLE
jgi:uncharacterized protein YyaL (SSP411 family)